MSIGTTTSEELAEALDPVVAENVQQGRLDDAEIQRLVVLSRDAAYQRSERVPVKTVEAFEPRSLVSIAMDAQKRRDAEMRTAAAAGIMVDPGSATGADVSQTDIATGDQLQDRALQDATMDADAPQGDAMMPSGDEGAPAADGDADQMAAEVDVDGDEAPTQGTSQIDFEAGHAAGVEEGRQSGLEAGHAAGLEEGRAAGRAEASAQLERAIQAFEAAAEKLGGLTEIDSKALGESIHTAILTLASERAGRAIAEQPDAFADRIEGLLAAIRTASGQPVIHLNPGDLGSIQPLIETREKLRHCSFVAAPDLAAGDLTVTVGTIGIDDIILGSSQVADDAGLPGGPATAEPAGAVAGSGSLEPGRSLPEDMTSDATAPAMTESKVMEPDMASPQAAADMESSEVGAPADQSAEAKTDTETDTHTDTDTDTDAQVDAATHSNIDGDPQAGGDDD